MLKIERMRQRGLIPGASTNGRSWQVSLVLGLLAFLLGIAGRISGKAAIELSSPQLAGAAVSMAGDTPETRVARGEYEIFEQGDSQAADPFEQEVYGFHESWTLWHGANGGYLVEGIRHFESPRYELHVDPFVLSLSRDFTIVDAKEFAKLRWVRDSGPLTCEFLPAHLRCSSGGSDPQKAIHLETSLTAPYGLLWPISPFSLSGITREIERKAEQPSPIELLSIDQPSQDNPVSTTILEGQLRYLGTEDFKAAGHSWLAEKFSLKAALHPEYLIWTSSKGLLLALAVEHEHKNWSEEGLRLAEFESWEDF